MRLLFFRIFYMPSNEKEIIFMDWTNYFDRLGGYEGMEERMKKFKGDYAEGKIDLAIRNVYHDLVKEDEQLMHYKHKEALKTEDLEEKGKCYDDMVFTLRRREDLVEELLDLIMLEEFEAWDKAIQESKSTEEAEALKEALELRWG